MGLGRVDSMSGDGYFGLGGRSPQGSQSHFGANGQAGFGANNGPLAPSQPPAGTKDGAPGGVWMWDTVALSHYALCPWENSLAALET